MGERKVQAKYYPPDFDPSRLPRIKKKRQNEDAVRFMLPMSVRCESCGEFMGTGLKFNAKKSDSGENYLGIRIFRFSMKCKSCPATFTIKTDPKNSDYTCESGVRRNYEPWKEKEKIQQESKEERERQDQDSMQALENRTVDAKKELEDLDVLNELKSANAQRASITVDDILEKSRALQDSAEREAEGLLKNQAKVIFRNRKQASPTRAQPREPFKAKASDSKESSTSSSVLKNVNLTLKVKKKIKKTYSNPSATKEPTLAGLAQYSSSSESE
ncbi:Coiled-coil domain-containing protein 94-like [Gracilariopsis chorda]|uniref:Splicing factor YJU2 n=1 Tax=Gracilariopsis chorda TaxID=448386 RepID=A0A2V3J432_9FLOR|nr:Coiled-coil domain-containing protein 94-like [Gracilariopsis chorda]|eukprot:PXF48747.1 Coiled-coil domain-containing protein 94-like [Gracilariopsis chorda]